MDEFDLFLLGQIVTPVTVDGARFFGYLTCLLVAIDTSRVGRFFHGPGVFGFFHLMAVAAIGLFAFGIYGFLGLLVVIMVTGTAIVVIGGMFRFDGGR